MLPFLTWQISATLTSVNFVFDNFFFNFRVDVFFTINLEAIKNCVEGGERRQ